MILYGLGNAQGAPGIYCITLEESGQQKIPPDGRDIEITLDLPVLSWRIEGYLISLVGSAIYITSYFLQIEETRRVLLHTP